MPDHKTKLSVLLPVRNEGVNVEVMLKFLRAVIEIEYEVVFVYDDPQDDSIPVVKRMQSKMPNLKLAHNDLGRGVANAIKTGVKASQGEYILIFAVDEVGPVLAIDDMIALMEEGCDFVSCTRYAHGGRRLGGSFIGGVLSKTANKIFRLITGSAFTDATTGIKMFRKKIFEQIVLQARPVGWAVVFEMAIKAQMLGLKLGEVPIISIDRLYGGKSTFVLGPWVKEYLKWFFWGMTHLPASKRKSAITVRMPHSVKVAKF